MARNGRPNKPYYWTEKKAWYCTIRGKRYKLAKDEDAALLEFHRLMSLPEPEAPPPPPPALLAVEVLDLFLVWCKGAKAEGTYSWYRKHIQAFIDSLPDKLIPADQLKPLHVTQWVKPTWSASYTRGAMVAVQRALRWAKKQGYPVNELRLEKPYAERRDNCPTQAEFDEMLTHARGCFKDVLVFLYETGCRPQEAIAIQPDFIHGDRVVFPVKESKGKKHKRVIYLNDKAKALVNNRIKPDKTGENPSRVFTNRCGRPWTAYSIDCRMKRISEKTGKKFSAYDIRHMTATRWLEAGMDHLTASKLLGHRDVTILSRTYAHIGERSDFLLEKLKSVQ